MGDLAGVNGELAGAWIEPRLGGEFGAVTLEVPKGYEAYARVFHPASDANLSPVRWAEVSQVCGTTAHRQMQWHAIVGLSGPEVDRGSKWPGESPIAGAMDIHDLDALCEILAAYTTNQMEVFFGLCTIELWEESFRREELKRNRLLRLPWGRDYIVLTGPLSAVDQLSNDGAANPGPSKARFKFATRSSSDQVADSASDSMEKWERRDAPNLIWPSDRSWLMASEVDFDSTLVGGSTELIQAIADSPKLEARQVEPTDSLAADADKFNTPPG